MRARGSGRDREIHTIEYYSVIKENGLAVRMYKGKDVIC